MKKYLFLIIPFFLLCIVYISKNIILNNSSYYDLFSQIQYSLYSVNTNSYSAFLSTGEREVEFDDNGISTKNVKYTMLEINIHEQIKNESVINVFLMKNNKSYPFQLQRNPFKNNFVGDIKMNIGKNDCLKICVQDLNNNYYDFENISSGYKKTYKDAINMCVSEYKNYIKSKLKLNKNCECYLTIINNENQWQEYFWNFMIITTDYEQKCMIFDVNDLEIIFKT